MEVLPKGTIIYPTTSDEVLRLSMAILDDPSLAPIIRRIGIHGDLSEHEEQALERFIRQETRSWSQRNPLTLHFAIVAARRIAAETNEYSEGESIQNFIKFNIDENGNEIDVKYDNIIPKRSSILSHVDEILKFARFLSDDGRIDSCLRSFSSSGRSEPNNTEASTMKDAEWRFQKKYGLFNRFGLNMAYQLYYRFRRGEIADIDGDQAAEYLGKYRANPAAGVRFEGISNV